MIANLLPSDSSLILHVDVDAFFASVEQLLIPALRGEPVIVGSGCIASCSYEARRFGLRAGMSLRDARRLCPDAVILKGNYPIYRCFAEHVWDVCRRHTCGLETYLDEAYGDATGMERLYGAPLTLGKKLQEEIKRFVGLPVSIGLACNRMMAKLASSSAKPGGVAWIRPGEEEEFLADLPIEKLLGVGHKTTEMLHDINIRKIGQLRALSRELLRSMWGQRGEALYDRCRGKDGGAAVPAVSLKDTGGRLGPLAETPLPPKTISRETTFHKPTCDLDEIRGMLFYLLERAMRAARERALAARCVELSIRYDDWKSLAANRTLDRPTADDDEAYAIVLGLLESLYRRRVALRHVGVVLSGFSPQATQARLFDAPREHHRRELYGAIDAIRDRYGHAALVKGESINLLGRLEQNDYGFILRTPSLTK